MSAAIAKATIVGFVAAFAVGIVLNLLVDTAYNEGAALASGIIMLAFASYVGARLALYWSR